MLWKGEIFGLPLKLIIFLWFADENLELDFFGIIISLLFILLDNMEAIFGEGESFINIWSLIGFNFLLLLLFWLFWETIYNLVDFFF